MINYFFGFKINVLFAILYISAIVPGALKDFHAMSKKRPIASLSAIANFIQCEGKYEWLKCRDSLEIFIIFMRNLKIAAQWHSLSTGFAERNGRRPL